MKPRVAFVLSTISCFCACAQGLVQQQLYSGPARAPAEVATLTSSVSKVPLVGLNHVVAILDVDGSAVRDYLPEKELLALTIPSGSHAILLCFWEPSVAGGGAAYQFRRGALGCTEKSVVTGRFLPGVAYVAKGKRRGITVMSGGHLWIERADNGEVTAGKKP